MKPFLLPGLLFLLAIGVSDAGAQAGWTQVEGEASARLPAPSGNPSISGGTLACAEQSWRLTLQVSEGHPTISGPVSFAVDRESFSATAVPGEGKISIPVMRKAIERLKSGLRLSIRLSLEGEDAIFNLRGSRRAIEAAATLCSPRDMSAFEQVELSAESPDIALARQLRDAEIKAFRISTASEPAVSAGRLGLGDGKSMMVVQLCGSSWYFGRSGCNLAGYAPEEAADRWRLVFDGEGAALYADPKSVSDGWPDLIAVMRNAADPDLAWRWDGDRYVFRGEENPPE